MVARMAAGVGVRARLRSVRPKGMEKYMTVKI